jgi:hypothetical protein
LRAAVDLARLRARQGECEQARELLVTTYGRFTEGFGTRDLQTAALLMHELDLTSPRAAL